MSTCAIFEYNIVKNMRCTKEGRIEPMGLIISPISMSSHTARRAFLCPLHCLRQHSVPQPLLGYAARLLLDQLSLLSCADILSVHPPQ